MKLLWETMALPSQRRALNIVNRLREGVPPEEDVLLFSIGRDELLRYFEGVLDDIRAHGQQGVKFIQADYGHGKTHFLDMLAQLALSRNFVVSLVTLDRETAPFSKLDKVVPLIMDGLMTPSVRTGGLGRILRDWGEKTKGQTANTILREIDESEDLTLLFPDFRLKLTEYARAFSAATGPDLEACLRVEKWFRGEETKARTFRSVPAFLAAFVQFVRYLGYGGFVVMLDEAESITLLSRITNRDQANENLRQIIDNQDLEGFFFVFASTPSFLSGQHDRGAQTYPALWRRISDPLGPIGQKALDKVIVELPALGVEEFYALAARIKTIYERAYSFDASLLTDNHLDMLSGYVATRTDRSVRTLVRSCVMLLDELRNVEGVDIPTALELVVERVIQEEQRRLAL